MGNILALFAGVFFLAFIVSLFKPSAVKMPSRKRAFLVYFGGSMVFSVIGSIVDPVEKTTGRPMEATHSVAEKQMPEKPFEYAELSLGDYRIKPLKSRHDIVDNYNISKKVEASSFESMYACLSQYSFTKSSELKLGEVLGWCYSDYERSPSNLIDRINFDNFQGNVSAWDGSYRPLTSMIKESLNDDSSYDHVSTSIRFVLNKDQHAVVKTIFRAKNAYGAVVKDSVTARVNIQTGEIEKILQ